MLHQCVNVFDFSWRESVSLGFHAITKTIDRPYLRTIMVSKCGPGCRIWHKCSWFGNNVLLQGKPIERLLIMMFCMFKKEDSMADSPKQNNFTEIIGA